MEKDILKKEVERKNGGSRWNQSHHVMVTGEEEAGPREQTGKQVQEQHLKNVFTWMKHLEIFQREKQINLCLFLTVAAFHLQLKG